jgi:hypothetical protein
VRLGLDSRGFVRELHVLDQSVNVGESPDRPREIRRLNVLKIASHFLGLMSQCREEIKCDHVLVLAEKWLAWVEQDNCA